MRGREREGEKKEKTETRQIARRNNKASLSLAQLDWQTVLTSNEQDEHGNGEREGVELIFFFLFRALIYFSTDLFSQNDACSVLGYVDQISFPLGFLQTVQLSFFSSSFESPHLH